MRRCHSFRLLGYIVLLIHVSTRWSARKRSGHRIHISGIRFNPITGKGTCEIAILSCRLVAGSGLVGLDHAPFRSSFILVYTRRNNVLLRMDGPVPVPGKDRQNYHGSPTSVTAAGHHKKQQRNLRETEREREREII